MELLQVVYCYVQFQLEQILHVHIFVFWFIIINISLLSLSSLIARSIICEIEFTYYVILVGISFWVETFFGHLWKNEFMRKFADIVPSQCYRIHGMLWFMIRVLVRYNTSPKWQNYILRIPALDTSKMCFVFHVAAFVDTVVTLPQISMHELDHGSRGLEWIR